MTVLVEQTLTSARSKQVVRQLGMTSGPSIKISFKGPAEERVR